MQLSSGTRLGPYEIVAPLGAGGMGEVYRARDTRLSRDVAVKVLPDVFAGDAERLARFEREAQVLASLNHPNIASIYGLEESGAARALVMELVDGITLAARIAQGPLPAEEALPLAKQMAEALEAAHERGVIHRDLKPANVKLTREAQVKVLDFGLAKALEGEVAEQNLSASPTLTAAATRAGVILGTAAYMSPEQAKGKPVDRRADIWAFGCVLFEMLSGRRAFEGENVSDTLAAVIRSEPDMNALPASVPARIRALLGRCLQKDPKRRLQAIGDARIEIEETLLAASGAVARVPEGLEVSPARKQTPWAVLAAAVSATAVLTSLVVWQLFPAPVAQPPRRLVVPLAADQALVVAVGSAIALSPDGSHLAYVASAGGAAQLYLRSLNDYEAKRIPSTEDVSGPFFSPDSQWVAFFEGARLKKVPVAGGPVTTIGDGAAPWGASWGDNGMIYFADRWHGESLLRIAAAGGAPEVVSRPDKSSGESSHRWPHILPGSKALLFTVATGTSFDDAKIALLDLSTGRWRTLVEGGSNPVYLPPGYLLYSRAGSLMAVPFDLKRLQVTGTPLAAVEGVMASRANGQAQFSASRDGTLLYLAGRADDSRRQLMWVDRKGTLKPVGDVRRAFEDLNLSPDGRRVAVTIEGPKWDVWVYDTQRGTLSRLTHEYTNNDPVWTADGKRLIFTSFREGKYGLFWKAADGSGPEERLTTSPHFHHGYTVSSDGRFLAYSELHAQTRGDLWMLPLDGERKPQLFLGTPANEWFPAFSPDGRWIAYTSDQSGIPEIYVQPFPGPGGRVQVSTDGGSHALWSSTGRELFYRSGAKTMGVSVDTSEGLRFGRPQALFEVSVINSGHPYDPVPGGQGFVFVYPGAEEAGPKQMNVILNWPQELKQRVRTGGQ